MIQCVTQADEAGPDRRQIGRLQRERFEEMVDLLDRVGGRGVPDRYAGKGAPDRLHAATRDLEDRPPGRFERDRRPRIGQRGVEPADGRYAARSGDPDDELGEAIDPWI